MEDMDSDLPRVVCRYGRGCTHQDAQHKEHYWHPAVNCLTDEQYRSHYICNECGSAFRSLCDLQLHLKRKTAWSDISLVGCRISCLVDNKEWHEGFVRSLSKQGKHCVEFHLNYEKRWLNMKKIAFFIAERPPPSAVYLSGDKKVLSHQLIKGGKSNSQNAENGDEFKDDYDTLDESDGLAPIDDIESWVYVEDISIDFSFAQSVLFKIFGGCVQETGHKTRGHICLTDEDKYNAKYAKGSLLYGELLPRGANKAFGPTRLAAESAKTLFDLGCGTGKIAIQAFLQFRNLEYVYGIELSEGRYKVAEEACLRMVSLLGKESYQVRVDPGKSIIVTELAQTIDGINTTNTDGVYSGRCLHLEFGNLFDTRNIEKADIVMLETDIPVTLHDDLCEFLNKLQPNAKVLSYLDFRKIWAFTPFTFKQLDINRHLSDRFPTSWSVQRGHHFFLWVKATNAVLTRGNSKQDKTGGSFRRSFNSRFLGNSWREKGSDASGGPEGENGDNSDSGSGGRCLPSGFMSFLSSLFPFRVLFRKKTTKDVTRDCNSNGLNTERSAPRLEITATPEYSQSASNTMTTSNENAGDLSALAVGEGDGGRIDTTTSTQSTMLAMDPSVHVLIPTHVNTITSVTSDGTPSITNTNTNGNNGTHTNGSKNGRSNADANTSADIDFYEDESEDSSEEDAAGGSSWRERGSEGPASMEYAAGMIKATHEDAGPGAGPGGGIRASVDTFIQKATSNILGTAQVNVLPISMTASGNASTNTTVPLFPSGLNDRVLSRSTRSLMSPSSGDGQTPLGTPDILSSNMGALGGYNDEGDTMLCIPCNDNCCIETDYNASRLRESSEHWVRKIANGESSEYILGIGMNSSRSSEKSSDDGEYTRSPQHRTGSSSDGHNTLDLERGTSPVAIAKMSNLAPTKRLLPPGSPSEGSESMHRSGLTPKRPTGAKMRAPFIIDVHNDQYGTDGVGAGGL